MTITTTRLPYIVVAGRISRFEGGLLKRYYVGTQILLNADEARKYETLVKPVPVLTTTSTVTGTRKPPGTK